MNDLSKYITKKNFYILFFTSVLIFWILCLTRYSSMQGQVCYSLHILGKDFTRTCQYIAERDPYNNMLNGLQQKNYLPFSYMIMYPFSMMADYGNMNLQQCWDNNVCRYSFYGFTIVSIVIFMHSLYLLCKKYSCTNKFLLLVVFSSVFLYSIETGNLKMLTFALVNYFIYLKDNSDLKSKIICVLVLSIASVLKVYPCIFILLWFDKSHLKEILSYTLLTLCLIILPFFFFKGGLDNFSLMLRNVNMQVDMYTKFLDPYRTGLISMVNFFAHKFMSPEIYVPIGKMLNYIIAILTLTVIFCTRNRYLKFALVCILCGIFPPSGYVYDFLALYPLFIYILGDNIKCNNKTLPYLLILMIAIIQPIQIYSYSYRLANLAVITMWLWYIFMAIKEFRINSQSENL